MVILAVSIRCKKEKVSESRDFFSSFVPWARSEPGCLQYDLFQAEGDPQVFYFFEKWADQETFDRHSAMPYLQEFHARFDELLEQKNQVLYLKPLAASVD